MITMLNAVSDIRAPAPPTNHQTRAGSSTSGVTSPKPLARIAGVLYLFLAIFGGFAQGFLEPKMYVVGDAVATAGNVLANAGLVRLGVVSELLGQIFFGLWLVPLGYLAKSGKFPKALGIVLIAGGVCYLVDLLAAFLVPDLGGVQQLHAFVVVPTTAIAEISMVIYLLVVGVKTVKPIERALAAA